MSSQDNVSFLFRFGIFGRIVDGMIRNILATFILVLSLTACGFTPMYGDNAGHAGVSAGAGLDHVEIAVIPDASGVYLRNALIDRFYQNGYPSIPTHLLTLSKIDELNRDLDITIESEATRKQIKLSTDLTLTDKASGAVVLSRHLTAVTSYNVVVTQFATRISENDARDAALNDLARQVETQVALYFKK